MKYKLFQDVVLLKDIPAKKLKMGDIATVVDHHCALKGEDGYSLEVFNALGNTIAAVTVSESEIVPLTKNCTGDRKTWKPRLP